MTTCNNVYITPLKACGDVNDFKDGLILTQRMVYLWGGGGEGGGGKILIT